MNEWEKYKYVKIVYCLIELTKIHKAKIHYTMTHLCNGYFET